MNGEKKVSLKQVQFQALTWQLSKDYEATHGCVMELLLHKTLPWRHIYGNKWNLFQISWAKSCNIITTWLFTTICKTKLSLMDLMLNTKQLILYFYLMLFQLRKHASIPSVRYVSKVLWNVTNISFSLTASSPLCLAEKYSFIQNCTDFQAVTCAIYKALHIFYFLIMALVCTVGEYINNKSVFKTKVVYLLTLRKSIWLH